MQTIVCGDALHMAYQLPKKIVNVCVTSPPYYKTRDYRVEGQLGQEKTSEDYIQNLRKIFRQVYHSLTNDGTLWIVISDKYVNGKPQLIPYRLAVELGKDKWFFKQDIIWQKKNIISASYENMFTIDYEHVLFFTKHRKYFFQLQYEPYSEFTLKEYGQKYEGKNLKDYRAAGAQPASDVKRRIISSLKMPPIGGTKKGGGTRTYTGNTPNFSQYGRHMRAVWTINTQHFNGPHFAVYPEKLVERILLSAAPIGICSKCGHRRKRFYKERRLNTRPGRNTLRDGFKSGTDEDPNKSLHKSDLSKYRQAIIRTEDGMTTCDCEDKQWLPPIILDPFVGAGTTALVAKRMGFDYIAIDINPVDVKTTKERLSKVQCHPQQASNSVLNPIQVHYP